MLLKNLLKNWLKSESKIETPYQSAVDLDITQALKDAENTLRDFIADTLTKSHGDKWEEKCGLAPEKFAKWRDRQVEEGKRLPAGTVEKRLLYYADFYDIVTLIQKNWDGDIQLALGDKKTIEVFLRELENLRNPDAHRREFLPHQKHLALGISGEIRTRIMRFRSQQDSTEGHFPRIECVRDSLGNVWTIGESNTLYTRNRLRPGDTVDFVITASDPYDAPLEYSVATGEISRFQSKNILSINIEKKHVGTYFRVVIVIRSPREYHSSEGHDATVAFFYTVLPPREIA